MTKIKAVSSSFSSSPLSWEKQSYTKLLQNKSTIKNAQNDIYKIKSYFPQPVQGARRTTGNWQGQLTRKVRERIIHWGEVNLQQVSDCVLYYFLLYNKPTLNNCFHINQRIN